MADVGHQANFRRRFATRKAWSGDLRPRQSTNLAFAIYKRQSMKSGDLRPRLSTDVASRLEARTRESRELVAEIRPS